MGDTFEEALEKAVSAAGMDIPTSGNALLSIAEKDRADSVPLARDLALLGFSLKATPDTARYLEQQGLKVSVVARPGESMPNALDLIRDGGIDIVINTPTKGRRPETSGFKIRRAAVEHRVACITSIDTAQAVMTVMKTEALHGPVRVRSLNEYLERLKTSQAI